MCKIEKEIRKQVNILIKMIEENKKVKAKTQRKKLDKLLKQYFDEQKKK